MENIIPFDISKMKTDLSNVRLRNSDDKLITINNHKTYIEIIIENYKHELFAELLHPNGKQFDHLGSNNDLVMIESEFDGDFSKLPVGTEVWDIIAGKGIIYKIAEDKNNYYPVGVIFTTEIRYENNKRFKTNSIYKRTKNYILR